MYVHNSSGRLDSVNVSGLPRNTASLPAVDAAAAAKAAIPPATPPPLAFPRSAAALLAAAGLPQDKLSAAIVSFARFFSLPLKPELMMTIRRQSLIPSLPAAPAAESLAGNSTAQAEAPSDSEAPAHSRAALALVSAAALDKGVELSPRALELFAAAVDPDRHRRHNSGKRRREKQPEHEDDAAKTLPLSAAGLKEYALKSAEQNPLLAVLNRLPGKNGQRWLVFPFRFSRNGRDLSVSLRILLTGDNPAEQYAGRVNSTLITMDIVEENAGGQRWQFVLETAYRNIRRLAMYVQPELPSGNLALLAGGLSQRMNIPPERIVVNNRAEPFPAESDAGAGPWNGVNEAV